MEKATRNIYQQTWQVGTHKTRPEKPEEWVESTVPGAVQLDWAKAHGYPSYIDGDHFKDYRWMEDVFWTYRTRLVYPELKPGERLFFVCGGVDYRFEVGLGDKVLHEQEGMFTPVELELTSLAKPGMDLWLCLHPIPKSFTPDPEMVGDLPRRQADHSVKPAVSYNWDFHPRLVPTGIWQETFIEIRPAAFLANATLDYLMNETCDQAQITVDVTIEGSPRGKVTWRLDDPDGKMVVKEEAPAKSGKFAFTKTVDHPRLWWPNGQGKPELYTSRVEFVDAQGKLVDAQQQRVGFRRVRLVMNENAWLYPSKYPKPRSHAPMTLEINGRRIFAKGSNWVSPQIFPALLDRGIYETQLNLAKQAHMNILRCWGGAPVMKEEFFQVSDELGIMIWQEFPLSCNPYPDDPAYLKVLDQESRSIIQRLKPHPSVVLWCGGNELFNVWSGMDDQSLPLRLLNSNCYQLDPERPFIMTSPIDGVAHGPYGMVDGSTNMESWALFQDSAYTAYCEFGSGSAMPSVETLKTFIPEDALFPVTGHPAWVAHNAVDAKMRPHHLHLDTINSYFGPSKNIEELVEHSQFLQAEGLRGAFEEVRRQKMEASMAINWCYNEPWPNACNLSIIAWPSNPKAGYHAVSEALRPVLASARIRKVKWKAGELFNPELWILSDAPVSTPALRIEAYLVTGKDKTFLLEWKTPALDAATNLKGPRIQYTLPDSAASRFQLVLEAPDHPEMNTTYTLLLD